MPDDLNRCITYLAATKQSLLPRARPLAHRSAYRKLIVDVELSSRSIVLGSEWMHFIFLVMKTNGCIPTNRDLPLTLKASSTAGSESKLGLWQSFQAATTSRRIRSETFYGCGRLHEDSRGGTCGETYGLVLRYPTSSSARPMFNSMAGKQRSCRRGLPALLLYRLISPPLPPLFLPLLPALVSGAVAAKSLNLLSRPFTLCFVRLSRHAHSAAALSSSFR